MVRGSSRRNEGIVKAAVMTPAVSKGNIRKPKSRSAMRRVGWDWIRNQTMRQPRQTATDRALYTITNTENETAIPRAANINLRPFLSIQCATHQRATRAAWLQRPGEGHRVTGHRARSGSPPDRTE